MARGWESKSVEDQVAEAEAAKQAREKPRLTEEQRLKQTERESLVLSHAQITNRLKLAKDRRYRAQLEKALHHLQHRLRDLEEKK